MMIASNKEVLQTTFDTEIYLCNIIVERLTSVTLHLSMPASCKQSSNRRSTCKDASSHVQQLHDVDLLLYMLGKHGRMGNCMCALQHVCPSILCAKTDQRHKRTTRRPVLHSATQCCSIGLDILIWHNTALHQVCQLRQSSIGQGDVLWVSTCSHATGEAPAETGHGISSQRQWWNTVAQ